ncbi:hypothetical protein JZ751_027734 [Albula glossodonta]|uniref:Uncharacterized protein n=1 Tax=Albula glossodonta TaxID=121402 RepID=A0A8T2PDM8_9TELE|nr:hypothetical protein JZ751_027734 [Albula glossodonta]
MKKHLCISRCKPNLRAAKASDSGSKPQVGNAGQNGAVEGWVDGCLATSTSLSPSSSSQTEGTEHSLPPMLDHVLYQLPETGVLLILLFLSPHLCLFSVLPDTAVYLG